VESDNHCYVLRDRDTPLTLDEYNELTYDDKNLLKNKNNNFAALLAVYSIIYLISTFGCALGVKSIYHNLTMYINKAEALSQFVSLISFLYLNIERFNHAGKVCSGDYLEFSSEISNPNYLTTRG
jgi:hypothetical protein